MGRGQRRKGRLKRCFDGGLVRGRSTSRTACASPWNSLYIMCTPTAYSSSGVKVFTTGQLQKIVNAEIGFEAETPIDFQIRNVSVWSSPSTTKTNNNFIVFAPCDLSPAHDKDGHPFNWYESYGTVSQPAHVHYEWSIPQQRLVQPYEYTEVPLFKLKVNKRDRHIVRFGLLWRPSNPDPRPTTLKTGSFNFGRERWRRYIVTSPRMVECGSSGALS